MQVRVHPDTRLWPGPRPTGPPPCCADAVAARGVAHAMFATGNSQLDSSSTLVTATPDVPWGDVVVFHMDEYVGVGPDHPAGFQRWIRERISDRVHPREAHYIDGLADPEAECPRYAALLRAHPLDLCCLGIGENGHLAFNDPPVADFDDPLDMKVVELDRDVPAPTGARGALPRHRRGAAPRPHRHDPRPAAGADRCSPSCPRSARPSPCAPRSPARCPRRARRRSCAPGTTSRCTSIPESASLLEW